MEDCDGYCNWQMLIGARASRQYHPKRANGPLSPTLSPSEGRGSTLWERCYCRDASEARSPPTQLSMPKLTLLTSLLSTFDQIKPPREFGQRQTAVLDGRPAVVARRIQRLAHGGPVNTSVARVDELAAVAIGIEFEILHVQFRDQRTERFHPVLRRRILHMVADIEVRFDPGVLKGCNKVVEEIRFYPKVIPDVLQR